MLKNEKITKHKRQNLENFYEVKECVLLKDALKLSKIYIKFFLTL